MWEDVMTFMYLRESLQTGCISDSLPGILHPQVAVCGTMCLIILWQMCELCIGV